jgi:hypothetical protein
MKRPFIISAVGSILALLALLPRTGGRRRSAVGENEHAATADPAESIE